MSRKSIWAAVIVSCLCVVLVASVIVIWKALDWIDPFDDQSFDATAWSMASDVDVKATMARDLVRNHLPKGTLESQVVGMLGPPDRVVPYAQVAEGNHLQGDKTYTYYIGSWSSHGFDDAFVYVHLDSSGKVVGAEINGY